MASASSSLLNQPAGVSFRGPPGASSNPIPLATAVGEAPNNNNNNNDDDNGKRKATRRFLMRGPSTDAEHDLVRATTWVGLAVVGVIAWYLVPVLWGLVQGDLGCPVWNGRVCNGKGVCGTGGYCVSQDPRFSGNALQVSACPLYDDVTGRTCGGRGVCSPFMRFEDVPVQCRWITPSLANGFRPKGQRGWDHAECLEFLRQQRQAFAVGDFSGNHSAGVPTCLCYGAYDGADCQYTACPTALNNQICSGSGDPVVHLFSNNTETIGNGCQCTDPFTFLDSGVLSRLNIEQRIALHRQIDALQQPFCGKLQQTPTGGLFLTKSIPNQFSTSHFKCFCQEGYFGLGCEYGRCPADEFGRICSGQGHPAFGFQAPQAVRTCRTVCTSPGSMRCSATDTCVTPRRGLTSRDQLCAAQAKCPTGARYRCPDGSCVPAEPLDVTLASACALGYTVASLDAAWLDAKRDEVRCLGVLDTCLPQFYNGSHTVLEEGTTYFGFASPPVWFYASVSSPQPVFVLVASSVGGDVTAQFDVPADTPTRIFVPLSNTQGAALDFAGDDGATTVVVRVFRDAELVVPFYNAIPTRWDDVRLVHPDTNEFLRVLAMDLRTEYGTGGALPHILLPSSLGGGGATSFLLPDGSVRSETSCLGNTLPCVWTYNSPTSITAGGGIWACWNGIAWSVSPTLCNANATLAPYRPLRSILHVQPRLASVALIADDVWNVQFRVHPDASTYNLTVYVRGGSLQIDEVELLQTNDLHVPCACQPGLVQRNRTIQNNRFAFDLQRQRTVHVAGEYAVVPVVEFGQMHPERGRIISSTTNTTRVELRRPLTNLVREFPTSQVRAISADEHLRGLDDCDIRAFPLRCPTGFCAPNALAMQREEAKTCNCSSSSSAASSSSPMSTCTCSDDVTCTCALNECTCTNTPLAFERALSANLQAMDANCTCFSLPLSTTTTPNFTTTQFVDVLELDPTRTLLAIVAPFCMAVDVYGIDDTLATLAAPQLLQVAYGCDGPSAMEITFFSLQQWTRVLVAGLPPNTTMEAQWLTVPMVRVADFQAPTVTYSASSNSLLAEYAAVFKAGTGYWESAQTFVEQPVWLRVDFGSPTVLDGFILTVRTAAIDTDLPVELQIQGLSLSDAWTLLGTVVSGANNDPAPPRQWIANDGVGAGQLFRAVRVVSLFPMALYEFIPMTRQGCSCLASTTTSTLPVLLPSAPELDTVSLLRQFLPRYLALNASADEGACVCEDTCRVITPGGHVVDVANDGTCNDELFLVLSNNLTLEEVTLETPKETLTPYDVVVQTFLDDVALTQNASTCFAKAFTTTPIHVVLHWCLGMATEPTQVEADAAYALFGVWNETRANNLSREYVFTFLDPVDNTTLLDSNSWEFANGSYTRQLNATVRRYGTALALQHVCMTGTDCSDCGNSLRRIASAPFLTCTPLTPRERLLVEDLLNQTVLITPAWRALAEYNRQYAVVDLRVNFTNIVWYPDCGGDVCPAPQEQRCPDGTCARTCSVQQECDRTGCITSDINTDKYACACREGWGGLRCEYDSTVAADPFRHVIDPNRYARCGGPPPLREQPNEIGLKTIAALTPADMERRNRAWKPATTRFVPVLDPVLGTFTIKERTVDVEYLHIKPRHAPFGSVVLVSQLTPAGDIIQSDCPPAHRGPLGEYLLLDDDVKVRNPLTGEVLEWTTYTGLDGATKQYIWDNAFFYNAIPYRCPNGHCVESPADCKASGDLHPICNGHGRCRPDGTCECAAGYTTFLYTDKFSRRSKVPYAFDDAKAHSVPQTWYAEPNFNWRDFGPKWCAARDCTVVDCSVPYGCPPGTPENEFRDKWVQCSARIQTDPKSAAALPRLHKCGRTEEDCLTNTNLIDTLPCSGNGVARRRDYRDPPEYYCQCGTPISKSASIEDVHETTQLRPNGFGGPKCDTYYCDEGQTSLHFSTFDSDTGKPYTDRGVPLPGLWKGFCGVPIGPDPLELNEWQACCAESRLDRCTSIPCRVANEISCVAPGACIKQGGTPLVYPCNNHGEARKDGTCACTADEEQGTGYTSNDVLFERPNCFNPLKCLRSRVNNAPCRRFSACSDPKSWTRPPDDRFFDDQLDVLMGRLGFAVSNRSLVREVTNVVEKERLLESAMERKALDLEADVNALLTCICVSANDTNTNPAGMVAYSEDAAKVLLPYGRGFSAPYEFRTYTFDTITAYTAGLSTPLTSWVDTSLQQRWSDGLFHEVDPFAVTLPSQTTVRIIFDSPKTFFLVRIHAQVFQAGLTVSFADDAGGIVCSRFTITDLTRVGKWGWFNMFCTPVYRDFQYQVVFPQDFATYCGGSAITSLACLDWQKRTCPGEYREPGSLTTFRDCSTDCCVATEAYSASPSAALRATFSQAIAIDEWRVFGYANTTVAIPPHLAYEFARIAGTGTDVTACAEKPDILFARQYLGEDKRYYMAGQFDPNVPLTESNSASTGFAGKLRKLTWRSNYQWCRITGGWMGSTRSAVRQDFGTDPAFFEEAIQTKLKNPETEASRSFVALRNVLERRIPSTSDFFYDQCQLHGCVHFMQNDMGGVETPVYAAKFPNQYKNPWFSSLFATQRPWTDILGPLPLRQRTPQTVSFSVGVQPRCSFVLYEDPTASVVQNKHPRWHKCCLCLPDLPEGCPGLFGSLVLKLARAAVCNTALGWNFDETNGICDASFPTGARHVVVTLNDGVFGANLYNLQLRYDNTGVLLSERPPRSMRVTASSNCAFVVCQVEPCDVTKPSQAQKYEYTGTNQVATVTFMTTPIVVSTNVLTGQSISVPYPPRVLKLFPASPYYTGTVRVNAEAFDAAEGDTWFAQGASSSKTMGWMDHPFMCMQAQYQESFRIAPLPNYAGVSFYVPTTTYTDTGVGNVWKPSTLFRVGPDWEIHACDTLDNLVPACTQCERPAPAKWAWDLRVFPSSGTTFPDDQPNAGFLASTVPVFVYGRQKKTLGAGGNPDVDQPLYYGLDYITDRVLVRLQAMRADTALKRHYAWFSCNLDIATYNVPQNILGWTHPHCGTIVNAQGRFEPFPCMEKITAICQYDFTQHVALPARTCDRCGPSTRAGGFPTPGRTCFDEFPQANRTANPFGFLVLDNFKAGTLNLLVSTTQYDYDVAREFLSNFTGLFWAVPEGHALWSADFSDYPLQVSPGVRENTYSGVNFGLTRIWPEDCGWQISKETGIATRRCAAQKEYCDPDAPQRAPIVLNPDSLPSILRPVGLDVDVRFEPTCATAVRPSSYVKRDRYGGATSFAGQFQVIEATLLFLRIKLLGVDAAVFNTGKNPHYYTFQANVTSTVAGQVDFTCAACTSPTTFRVWIAPRNPNYLYPSSPLVIGTFQLQGGPSAVTHRYAFDVDLTPQAVFSNIHRFANVTYQVVGWDIVGARPDAVVHLSNALITDAKSVAACRQFRGNLPKYGPKSSVDSGAPNNVCLMRQEDVDYYGRGALGECLCDKPFAGLNCDAAAITTRFGKFAFGGWGESGRVITPIGTVATASALDVELGMYLYVVDGEPQVGGKCRHVGRILRTRLQPQPAYDYLKIYVLENTFDAVLYQEVFEGVTNFMVQSVVASLASSASVALASWVSASEAAQYLVLATNNKLPLFVDLERHNVTEEGNADLVWRTRGLTYRKCTGASECDTDAGAPTPVVLPAPVDCSALGPWGNSLPTYCSVINFNNLLYTVPLGSVDLTNGVFQNVMVTTPFSFPTPSPLSAFTFYIWMSSASAVASITTVACSCTTSSPTYVGQNAYLQVFECVPLAGTPSCTLQTAPLTTPIFEVQMFNATDSVRVPFYPY